MASSNGNRTLHIVIPIFPGFTALDAIGPYESLHRLPNTKVHFVSNKPGLYTADSGTLSVQADASFDEFPNPDVILVPGAPVVNLPLKDQVLMNWIKKAHETSLYTTSVCTGALTLGTAGLLDGLQATTHWLAYDQLEKLGAKPVSHRIVRQGKIITSAGVSAGVDMGIALAATLKDDLTAKIVQLLIEYDPQPPFDVGSVAKAGEELVKLAIQYNNDYPPGFQVSK